MSIKYCPYCKGNNIQEMVCNGVLDNYCHDCKSYHKDKLSIKKIVNRGEYDYYNHEIKFSKYENEFFKANDINKLIRLKYQIMQSKNHK